MIIQFYGIQPPNIIQNLRLGGVCPNCKIASRFTVSTLPNSPVLVSDNVTQFIASYHCDNCLSPLPVKWQIREWVSGNPVLVEPEVALVAREPYDFSHVPPAIKAEIEEALSCLSVNAYNGFAAVCRRAIQALCVNLGADASNKVKSQVEEMIDETGLGEEWKELAIQIMLSGHDGSHPHLPEMNHDRATVMLSLIQDLTYELYTRPGNIKHAAKLRKDAIDQKKG